MVAGTTGEAARARRGRRGLAAPESGVAAAATASLIWSLFATSRRQRNSGGVRRVSTLVPQRLLLLSALVLTLAAGALSHTAAAHAAGPEVGVTDDRVLLASGPKAAKMVQEWQREGVDTVRIFLLWTRVVP